MTMHFIRRGQGKPLLLIHGLGGNWRSWETVLDDLAAARDVIAPDLPGFGKTPPLSGAVTIAELADALEEFLAEHDLRGVDVVGNSMGARLALELARRGAVGTTVALNPGGFWSDGERRYFGTTVGLSLRLVKSLQALLPALVGNPIGRTILLPQFSAHPWALSPEVTLHELQSYAAAPSLYPALDALVHGPNQEGISAEEQKAPILIVWGRQDRVCWPTQVARAQARFPGARLQWFDDCGHFPHWDQPRKTTRVILAATG